MNNSSVPDQLIAAPIIKIKPQSDSALLKYRGMVLYRFVLAIFGGYLLSALTAIVVAKAFIDYRASAAIAATLLAFSIHCAAFIWVFMVHKTLKASLGIFIPCFVLWLTSQFLGA
ncbi:hypothetical protein [Acinetobacter sp. ANC 4178]|uniref:hypothetical protein n=1 Tax=Acinetobacter sp. ANC 4178 TaxID=2529839 RepID=UPI001040C92A|nr:hypothetical protein [Acinetobacter sp. ANC 4178]TCB68819.1 hypothetical protein E0H87_02435 [Acinetobacter sp. ANC 4178]